MEEKHSREAAASFLAELEARQPKGAAIPLVDKADAQRIVEVLDHGLVSARRMAGALDATFQNLDATFAHHGLEYRIGL